MTWGDGRADFIQGGLSQWGFVVRQKDLAQLQLQQGQVGIYSQEVWQGSVRKKLLREIVRDNKHSCWKTHRILAEGRPG